MITYEDKVYQEMLTWKLEQWKKSSWMKQLSKKAQKKFNDMLPEKAHIIITDSMKAAIQATLVGSKYTTAVKDVSGLSLEEKEALVDESINTYRKTATVEGAGTGAGGILLALADFPLLLAIKMKFLFATAAHYGFDVNKYEERLYILHIFQLTYSSDEHRSMTMNTMENWEVRQHELKDMDWRIFQQEYRDYIDLVKMLQMIPGFGAIVGAFANYNLLDRLGVFAKNAYRMRLLDQ